MKKERAFNNRFLEFMKSQEFLWPNKNDVEDWFRDHTMKGMSHGGNGKKSPYRDLQAGEAVAIRFTSGLIQMFFDMKNPVDDFAFRRREAILEYYKFPKDVVVAKVLDQTCSPQKDSPQDDWILKGLDYLWSFAPNENIRRSARLCRLKDLEKCETNRDVLQWIYINVGRDVHEHNHGSPAKPDSQISNDVALEIGENYVQVPIEEYRKKMMEWAGYHDWVVVLGRNGGKRTGVSVILPLTEKAYYEVRNGEKSPWECGVNDFEVPSNFLLVQVFCVRLMDLGGDPLKYSSKAQRNCALLQVAALSKLSSKHKKNPLRILSFAGMPTSEARLKAHRYQRLDKVTKGHSAVPLYERTLAPVGFEGLEYRITSAMMALVKSRHIRKPPDSE
jgi:hypothetical protein